MRDLIDRQTTIEAIKEASKYVIKGKDGDVALYHPEKYVYAVRAVSQLPTVTRISYERYNRLIGKPIKP